MAIKTFDEWLDSEPKIKFILDKYPEEKEYVKESLNMAYIAGIKAATKHYEEEAIKTHEYYDKAFRDLAEGKKE